MNELRPTHPYRPTGSVEYRVLHLVNNTHDGPTWFLRLQTDKLDRALDAYGDGGPTKRLERCEWAPAPEVAPWGAS